MTASAGHALVVGGTGMLGGVVHELAGQGWRVGVIARRASRYVKGPQVYPLDCDYHDEVAFSVALARAVSAHGPITLAIAWFHTLKIAAPTLLAEAMDSHGKANRYVQVLGSAAADPDRPDRLATAAGVVKGRINCELRQVILGFQLDDDRARWLTNTEISQGVLSALASDAPLRVIGVAEPWTMRPER